MLIYFFWFSSFFHNLRGKFCAEIKDKNASFGTSLLLANIGPNSAVSPKIVDGSFAALFDNETDDVVVDFSEKLKFIQKDIHTNCEFSYFLFPLGSV